MVLDLSQDLGGTPAAIENGGISLVTTLFAPITQRSPTVTPLVMTTFAPAHTLSPTRVGPSETLPVRDGQLELGTWQQVVLIDFDDRPRQRTVVVQVLA